MGKGRRPRVQPPRPPPPSPAIRAGLAQGVGDQASPHPGWRPGQRPVASRRHPLPCPTGFISPSSSGFVEFALGLLDAFLQLVNARPARLYLVAQTLQTFNPALDGPQLLLNIVELSLAETSGLIQPVLLDGRILHLIPLRARLLREPLALLVELERLLDLGQREAEEIPQLDHPLQLLDILGTVLAKLPWQARGRLDQSFLLIEAQGRLAQFSALGDLVDTQQV